ncbi:MAG TPA: hypothetical protein PKA74_01795, partial [Bauldia sp.]|nr:hypothetical protein [Bauldia sp.]
MTEPDNRISFDRVLAGIVIGLLLLATALTLRPFVPAILWGIVLAVTAAPGVAFNYRYAFSLPAGQIAAAQEAHAAACEQLGIARCRITGMRHQLLGENRVEAMLAFKLD